jgi:hypothetical protein
MEKDKVPQDDENMLEGKTRELQYAIDESGKYVAVKSVGWEPKNIILKQEWELINEKVAKAKALVEKGKYSPLYYHMKKNLMSSRVLANYAEISWFKVLSHLKPKGFLKITEEQSKKYKYAFNMKESDDLSKID